MDQQPLEETPEVAAAVADDTTVPQLVTGGGPDDQMPEFREPEPVAEPRRELERDGAAAIDRQAC